MSLFRVDFVADGEPETMLIEAPNRDTAMFNARGVLTYSFDDIDTVISDISVVAWEGDPGEFDHLHDNVAEMERVLAETQAKVRVKQYAGNERLSIATDGTVTAVMPEVGEPFDDDEPFHELPFEVAVEVDKVIAADFWAQITWEGKALLIVSDTFLAQAAETAGKSFDEAKAGAQYLERGDGRKVYIWRAPAPKVAGRYGLGKAKLG